MSTDLTVWRVAYMTIELDGAVSVFDFQEITGFRCFIENGEMENYIILHAFLLCVHIRKILF